ncbi:DUF732 domain-containing protein [Mycobacterium colombiense]|uniref:DUF732 domain-containing protein n=1 Tax=Mycobacterium colombiense TaxID=339268 RepID=UPI00111589D4|nr:DUF732 domain-containing protein [Mycobacterium colombiense]
MSTDDTRQAHEPETTDMPTSAAQTPELAWSLDDGDIEPQHRSWPRTAALATGILAAGSSIAAGLWLGVPGFKHTVTNVVAPHTSLVAPTKEVMLAPVTTTVAAHCAPGHNADKGCLPVVVPGPTTVTVTATPTTATQRYSDGDNAENMPPVTTATKPALTFTAAQDQQVIDNLRGLGYTINNPATVLYYAHEFCRLLHQGESIEQADGRIQAESGDTTTNVLQVTSSAQLAYPNCY